MPAKKTNGETTATARRRVQVDCSTGGRTHQSFKQECDINNIMAKYRKTGTALQRTDRPQYEDFSNVGDYQDALNTILLADAMFGELDSSLRARFENNPQLFLDFVSDPDNQDEAYELGIASRPPAEPEPQPEPQPDSGENPIIGGE